MNPAPSVKLESCNSLPPSMIQNGTAATATRNAGLQKRSFHTRSNPLCLITAPTAQKMAKAQAEPKARKTATAAADKANPPPFASESPQRWRSNQLNRKKQIRRQVST